MDFSNIGAVSHSGPGLADGGRVDRGAPCPIYFSKMNSRSGSPGKALSWSPIAAISRVVGRIAYCSQICLLAWEEGLLLHEQVSSLTNGQVLMDLFRRRAGRGSGARAERGHRTARARNRGGAGIQEAHISRLILLNQRAGLYSPTGRGRSA